jgi:hypothetical protein
MGINILDRRNNSKGKSSENRQRFLNRVKNQIKEALPGIIKNTDIKDIVSNDKIKVPIKRIDDPHFQYDRKSGENDIILPGNKEFSEGDKIKKEKGKGKGSGKGASNGGEISEDEFTITINKDEFLDYFFEDLELPDLVKKHFNTITKNKLKKSGYSNQGTPNRLSVTKSYENSLIRKMATILFFDKKIKEIEEKISKETDESKLEELKKELDKFIKMKKSIPFMDDIDLKYNNYEQKPYPITSAVMICIMDVSGSMTEFHKDIAKRFFMLLYLFLNKQYEKIEIVYIRHHTEAKEVDEEEFFNSKETGGTIVSNALKLAKEIINKRYSTNEHNIYLTQISDGDVWDKSDATLSKKLLKEILSQIQWAWYVEVSDMLDTSGLMNSYERISNKNFDYGIIKKLNGIWPLFTRFFSKNKETK